MEIKINVNAELAEWIKSQAHNKTKAEIEMIVLFHLQTAMADHKQVAQSNPHVLGDGMEDIA